MPASAVALGVLVDRSSSRMTGAPACHSRALAGPVVRVARCSCILPSSTRPRNDPDSRPPSMPVLMARFQRPQQTPRWRPSASPTETQSSPTTVARWRRRRRDVGLASTGRCPALAACALASGGRSASRCCLPVAGRSPPPVRWSRRSTPGIAYVGDFAVPYAAEAEVVLAADPAAAYWREVAVSVDGGKNVHVFDLGS